MNYDRRKLLNDNVFEVRKASKAICQEVAKMGRGFSMGAAVDLTHIHSRRDQDFNLVRWKLASNQNLLIDQRSDGIGALLFLSLSQDVGTIKGSFVSLIRLRSKPAASASLASAAMASSLGTPISINFTISKSGPPLWVRW